MVVYFAASVLGASIYERSLHGHDELLARAPAAGARTQESHVGPIRSHTFPSARRTHPQKHPPARYRPAWAAQPRSAHPPTPSPDPAPPSRRAPSLESPPAEPLLITSVAVEPSLSGLRVSWQTSLPTTAQGAYGLGADPTVWTPPDPVGVEHETVFAGLRPSTNYTLWIQGTDEWDRSATEQLQLMTSPPAQVTPDGASATLGDGTILVGGEPLFPLALWDVCPSAVSPRIRDGINLFMGDGCGRQSALLSALHGQAYGVAAAASGLTKAPGLIGWYYPDELDGRLPNPLPDTLLGTLAFTPPAGLLSFLTLTNHFYSGANPLDQGRSFYPQLASMADVLGFDLYPLQNWCQEDRFADVYNAQRELEALANGKPTYQWIEVRRMDCAGGPLDPTPTTVRAETWLAVAGGADGIGYFPNNWNAAVGVEIRDLNSQITELAPALFGDELETQTDGGPVKVSARMLNGAIYVIAVNTSRTSVNATIRVPGLGGGTVDVLDEGRQLEAANDAISDSFEPLGVNIYVAPPPGWILPASS